MNIAPWVPAALEFGGLVASGVGSWLDSRDRRKYQNQIGQMQEDARKRVADAERLAMQRANRLSLLTGRNVRPEPIDIDLPVVPQYKSGTSAKIFQGLGFGLGASSLASSAVQKAQQYNTQLAEKAGKQQAAIDIANTLSNQPKIGSSQAYESSEQTGEIFENFFSDVDMINSMGTLSPQQLKTAQNYMQDKYQQRAWTSGEVLSKTLGDVRQLEGPAALKNLKNNPENAIQFDGLFSGNAESSFLGSYAEAMAGSYDTLKRQEVDQLNMEAQLEAQRMRIQTTRMSNLLSEKHRSIQHRLEQSDNTQEYLNKGAKLLEDSKPLQGAVDKADQLGIALNLIQANVSGPWIQATDENGNVIIDPITKKPRIIENKNAGAVIDENTGELVGIRLSGGVTDAMFQLYQRGMDDGVVHATDIERIRESIDTTWERWFQQPFESWYNRSFDPESGVGPRGGSPQPISEEGVFEIVSILDTNRDLMLQRIDEHVTNTINSLQTESVLQNIRDGGIYDWQTVEQFQRELVQRLGIPYKSYLDADKFALPRSAGEFPFGVERQQQLKMWKAGGANVHGDVVEAIKKKGTDASISYEDKVSLTETDPDTMIGNRVTAYWTENLFKNPDVEPLPGAFLGDAARYITDPSRMGQDAVNAFGDLRRQAGVQGSLNMRDAPSWMNRLGETAAAVPIVAGQQVINSVDAVNRNLHSPGTYRNYMNLFGNLGGGR